MVAVIDDELARKVFKTANVTGKTLDIYGSVFRIVGVVKREDTLIGKLTDDGIPDVYIPAAVMLELDATARITAFQVKTAGAGTPNRNIADVSAALRQIGKEPSNYNISDYNLRYSLMEQKPLLLVFILGIAAMLTLLAYIKKLMAKLYYLIRDGCRTDYFSNAIRSNLAGIGTYMLEMASALGGTALIWLGIKFRPYIPPAYIPDELINISYYSGLIKGLIEGRVQSMGYIAPHAELTVNTIDTLLNLLFCISVIPGFLLLYTGFRELKTVNTEPSALTLIFGLFFVLALIILAAAAFWAGLPFAPGLKGILVAWAFIYINILRIQKRTYFKERKGIENV
jgi:hypothetical protein